MINEEIVWQYKENEPNPYHVEWQVFLDAIRQNKNHNEARRGQADMTAVMGRMATTAGLRPPGTKRSSPTFSTPRKLTA